MKLTDRFSEKEKKRFNRWLAQNRKEAVKTGFIIGFHFFLGFLLGWFLFFGPLEIDNSLVQFLGGLIVGIINLSLTTRQKFLSIIGRKKEAARLEKNLRLGRRGVIGVFLVLIILQMYLLGIFPPFRADSEVNFNRMLRVLRSNYAYEVDWDSLENEYRPLFAESSFPEEFYPLAKSFLGELNDPGVGIFSDNLPTEDRWLGLVRKIEGQALVVWVRPGADFEGLEPGARILEREGIEASEFVEEIPSREIGASSPQLIEYNRYSRLLTLGVDEEVEIVYETPEGEIISQTIYWDEDFYGEGEDTPYLQVEELAENAVLIEINTFFTQLAPDLLVDFDTALNEHLDKDFVVLDLRENRGGSLYLAELVAGRFFAEHWEYGEEKYPSRLPHKAWRGSFNYDIQPREPIFEGEVILLVDTTNMGNAELFISAFKDSDRAKIIGLPTAGSAGESLSMRLSEGQVNYSFGDFMREGQNRLFGEGITPHYEIEWRREHLVEGIDPYREALNEIIENH